MDTSDIPLLLKATVKMYADAAREATTGLLRNWPILLGSVALSIVFIILARLIAPLGGGGALSPAGFVLGLAMIAFVSLYYSWIAETVAKGRITFRDLIQFDGWHVYERDRRCFYAVHR